jgi:elongation factor P
MYSLAAWQPGIGIDRNHGAAEPAFTAIAAGKLPPRSPAFAAATGSRSHKQQTLHSAHAPVRRHATCYRLAPSGSLVYNGRWAKANISCVSSATPARSFTLMAIPATQMRPGMIIKHKDQLHLVFKVEHRTPGNLRAFIQAKLRNIKSGAMFEERFRSADAIEKVVVDEIAMEFLYADGDDYYFMNPVDFEQTVLKGDTLGDAVEYLTPNLQIKVSYHDGQAVGIELPTFVELTVVETEPGLKSATASSVTKPAKMETGLVVQVPPFINEGEKIRVDTSEGTYMSRA